MLFRVDARILRLTRFYNMRRFIFAVLLLFVWSAGFPLQAERIVTETSLAPGCTYTKILDRENRLGIYVLKVDLRHPAIRIFPVIGQDAFPGRETIRLMSLRYDRKDFQILGGINGDFWQVEAPIGFMVQNGRLLRSPNLRSTIAFSEFNEPDINVFSTGIFLEDQNSLRIHVDSINRFHNQDTITLFTDIHGERTRVKRSGREILLNPHGRRVPSFGETAVAVEGTFAEAHNNVIPDGKWVLSVGRNRLKDTAHLIPGAKLNLLVSVTPGPLRIWNAISGGPRILRSGRVSVEWQKEGIRPGFDSERHPRTAVGYTHNKRYLVMMVVDGRQPWYSRGVSLYELAKWMKEFGCTEALNLDGGGSSSMVVLNKIVNTPSDITGLRPVSSGLFIVSRSKNE